MYHLPRVLRALLIDRLTARAVFTALCKEMLGLRGHEEAHEWTRRLSLLRVNYSAFQRHDACRQSRGSRERAKTANKSSPTSQPACAQRRYSTLMETRTIQREEREEAEREREQRQLELMEHTASSSRTQADEENDAVEADEKTAAAAVVDDRLSVSGEVRRAKQWFRDAHPDERS